MAVDLDVLARHGVSVEALKAKFTADKLDDGTKKVVDLIRSRINEGITTNLRNCRLWHAIDNAFDVPFTQITPTLVKSLLSARMDDEGVLKAVTDWGITHLIREEVNPQGGTKKIIDLPAFFDISVPVAKAYAIIRTAKIFNDRNVYPLFKYEPARLTLKNKMRCEVITDRIQAMTSQYGYGSIMRQAILSKMIYGICLQFPAECWHTEKQLVENEDGKESEKVMREGLRYNLPHPSRTFYDQNYRVGTFNTDTGCCYAGYWDIIRYGDIKGSDVYWNTDKITYGTNWIQSWPTFFNTLFPCSIRFPDRTSGGSAAGATPAAAGQAHHQSLSGAGALDREAMAGFYAAEETDKAVTKTELFMKFVPKAYGFGDYAYPVWFRFVVASDTTVIYAEPLGYSPIVYRGYDAHEARELNASLVLEALPFQDHIGNLLSQQLLTIKQNLLAAVFVNEDAVGVGMTEKLQNLGKKLYVEVQFIPYSQRKAQMAGKDFKEAFIPVNFPRLDTTAMLTGVRVMLDMMERILVMSSQEIGAAATHEQTAEETRVIQSSTSNRLNFTASYDDDADLAWKKQLYDALMAYGEEDIYAEIGSIVTDDMEKSLKELGFSVEERGDQAKGTRTSVKGTKTALMYESFASTRDGQDRINNVAISNAMIQLLQVMMANPILFEAIGAPQAVKMINQIANLAGFMKDFKLEVSKDVTGMHNEQQQAEMQQQVVAMLQQLKQALEEEMGKAIGPLAQQLQQVQQVQQAATQAIPKLGQQLEQMQQGIQQAFQKVGEKDNQQDQAIQEIVQRLEQLMQIVQSASAPPALPQLQPA